MASLERLLRYICLTGVFALPFIALYVANSMFFPFISGKNFAFRIIVELIFGAWLALALVRTEYRPARSWLLWAFAAFVLLIGISDTFGVYPEKSFWSNYERMEGWVTLAHLFAYFVVMTSVLNTEKLWRAWMHTTLGVSISVAFIGLFQLMGMVQINQSGSRLDARLGNSTYAGVYMLFHIFMAALLLARAWAEKQKDSAFAVWLYGSIILLDTFILFFTATRGAILGLAGGAGLSGLILILLAPRSRVAWRVGAGLVALIVLATGVFLARDTAFVRGIEPLQRLTSIIEEGYPLARRLNVEMAWQGFQERPIFGWGQENYAAVFDKYYKPAMYAQEQWFDRTHNIVFDWLIAGGILGFLAYLSLYLFALLAVWRSGAFAPYERALLTGLFAGYFFYLLFTFDNILSYILFISLLAYITVRASIAAPATSQREAITPLPRSSLPVVAGIALVMTAGVVWYVNADAIAANRTLIQALAPHTEGPDRNLALFDEALAYDFAKQEVREQFAQAAMAVMAADVPNEVKQRFLERAREELVQQSEDAPLNARALFFLGALLDRAGAFPDAARVLDEALKRSPNKQGILFERGFNALAQGKGDEGVAFFKKAYELAPEYVEARVFYISALIRTGNNEEADALLAPLIESGEAVHPRIAVAYAEAGNFQRVIDIWTPYIEAHPENLDARLILASAYDEMGDRAGAIAVLKAAKRDIPEAASHLDVLLQQLGAVGE